MSHPGIPIDWKTVDRLLEAGCDGTQVAAHIGVHPETLYDRIAQEKGSGFSEYKATKRANGDSLLLAKQFKVAMEGDRTMLVWLGKQRLEQTDKRDVTSGGKVLPQPIIPLFNVHRDDSNEEDQSTQAKNQSSTGGDKCEQVDKYIIDLDSEGTK